MAMPAVLLRTIHEFAYARQIAEATNTDLLILELSSTQVIAAIRYAAERAIHSFLDFSSIDVQIINYKNILSKSLILKRLRQ